MDATLPEMGAFRWLTVGPVGQSEIDIVLMAIPEPPVPEPDTVGRPATAGRRCAGRRCAGRYAVGSPSQ